MNESEHTDDGTDARTDGGTAQAREAMAEAGPTGDVPEGAIASVEDFAHQRDGEGDLLPVTERVPGTETFVRVIPITQGEANEWLPDSGNPNELDDDEMLELVREFVVEPDFSGVESVQDFKAFGLDPLLMAVMNASGFDMAQGMIAESSEFVEAVQGNSSRGN